MKNDRAYPCDTQIITNVNGNNEENGKVFKNKVFTWVKLKLNILTKNGRLLS